MNQGLKRFIALAVFIILILTILLLGLEYQRHLSLIKDKTLNSFPLRVYLVTFPIILGSILAVPKLITSFVQKGRWVVDWLKIIVIGIPTLFLSTVPLTYFTQIGGFFPFILQVADRELYTISGLIFGYTLVESIYKREIENNPFTNNDRKDESLT